ncbi:hypothetical protein AAFO92_04505 [Roseovarius sp. CAU 1744]|uniref:hypothetical protein n=1 Tax=Roseovarius sp. CAU 1744 TaxID=3140368 RepID=UPI00325AFAF9
MRYGIRIGPVALALGLMAAPTVSAEEAAGDYVQYSLEMQGSRVKGIMLVARLVDGREVPHGYSLRRVAQFITDDCASGKVGKFKLGKRRTNKGKGEVKQPFRAFCLGGPHPRIGAPQEAKVLVTRQEDGRDLAEYSYFHDGRTVTSERYR